MRKVVVAAITVLVLSGRVAAEPVITSVSGFPVHGSSVTITGSSFGEKDPAAPALWQTFESKALGDHPVVGDGWGLGSAFSYWTVDDDMRSVTPPHARSTKYLIGNHGTNSTNIQLGYNAGTKSNTWFIMTYLRTSPEWASPPDPLTFCDPVEGVPYTGIRDNNYKEWWFDESCEVQADNTTMYIASGSNVAPSPFTSDADAEYSGSTLPCGGEINDDSWGTNPSAGWGHKMVVLKVNPGALLMRNLSSYGSGISNLTDQSCAGELFPAMADDRDEVCSMLFGSFARYCMPPSYNGAEFYPNMYRYLDDVYIDTTFSRVMIGNSADFATCTRLEPQIPTRWDAGGGSIDITVNLGSLTEEDDLYVYVFDSTNDENDTGFGFYGSEGSYPKPCNFCGKPCPGGMGQ